MLMVVLTYSVKREQASNNFHLFFVHFFNHICVSQIEAVELCEIPNSELQSGSGIVRAMQRRGNFSS